MANLPFSGEARAILELAKTLALRAGEIQRERYEQTHEIETKSASIDLVTEVDRLCEALIVEGISRDRPGDSILAEEGGSKENPRADWHWVIDPLDGTVNYAHGFPRFCVSIGVEYHAQRHVAVVYDPLLDELFWAVRGQGAFLGDRRLSVSEAPTLEQSLVATGFAYDVHRSDEDNLAQFSRMLKASRGIRRDGSAALDLCYVASGRLDAYWEHKLHPWDVAAGILIVDEAGGRSSDLAGDPPPSSGQEIVVTNGVIHEELLAIITHD